MSFDPCIYPLKIRESIETPTPKVGAHLGVWRFIPSHSLHSYEHEIWLPGSLLARTFTSPCIGREPKAKVATTNFYSELYVHPLCEFSIVSNFDEMNYNLVYGVFTIYSEM